MPKVNAKALPHADAADHVGRFYHVQWQSSHHAVGRGKDDHFQKGKDGKGKFGEDGKGFHGKGLHPRSLAWICTKVQKTPRGLRFNDFWGTPFHFHCTKFAQVMASSMMASDMKRKKRSIQSRYLYQSYCFLVFRSSVWVDVQHGLTTPSSCCSPCPLERFAVPCICRFGGRQGRRRRWWRSLWTGLEASTDFYYDLSYLWDHLHAW